MRHSKGLVGLAAVVVAVLWGPAFGQQQNTQQEGQRRERGQRGRQEGAQDQGQQGREGRRDRGDRGDRGRRGDGQNDQNNQNQGGERGGRDRGPGGFGGPGGGPGRGGPREFTPEQREQFYEQMATRQLERLTSAYELNPEQQTQAKGKLDELKAQQRTYSEEHMSEFTDVRRQMEQLREQGLGWDSPQARELGQRMRTMWEGAPLMNRENVASSIEKILPPDQAQRGRQKWDAEGREWDQRREEMRQRFEQRRQEGGGGPGDVGRRGRDGRRGDQEGADGAASQPAAGARGFGDRREGGRWGGRGERGGDGQQVAAFSPDGGRQYQPIAENPVGPWEQYLRDFIRRYRLDEAQQATAWSVLREVQVRRTAYEQSMRDDFTQARGIADINDRERRVESLNRPVVRMFDELKGRLDKIPSADQLKAYGPPRPTSTQPAAAATTRPS